MPVLLLPPRVTPDSQMLQQAALDLGWAVERLENWRPPLRLREADVALYGEPLFVDIVAEPLGVALLEPTSDWLIDVPRRYLQRDISPSTLEAARRTSKALFIKPALDKCFPAGVYATGADLPENIVLLPGATPVLLAEPVYWEVTTPQCSSTGLLRKRSTYWCTLAPEGGVPAVRMFLAAFTSRSSI